MASYYPDELINEVISANNLVDVVGSYVKLKRSGNRYMGLCPFHSEKTPSFHVSADKQLYHCFGCGEGGSVVQFIMKMENLDFVEAIKQLAARANINLPEGNEKASDGEYFVKKQKMLEMYVTAARFYHSCLAGEGGKTALAYLAARQIDPATITRFGMGYSPNEYDTLYNHLKEKGFDEGLMLESGLIRKNEKNGKPYDFFRDRVMVPIFDIRGNVIAFGGRTMVKSDGRKYINSSDSMIFNKSKTLYGLNFAKKNCSERIILVEGYMDVISLHKYGFTNAVAGLGTAFTPEHAKILSRYTKELVICYDSDEAGQAAVMRALPILAATDLKLKVMVIPEVKDADEYLRLKGAAKFKTLVEGAKNHILYKIDRLKQQYDIENTEQKIEFVTKAAEIFSEVNNEIEREAYVKQTSAETGISEEAIQTEINRCLYRTDTARDKSYGTYKKAAADRQSDSVFRAQAALLNLMCSDITVWRYVRNETDLSFFEDSPLKAIASDIYSHSSNDRPPDFSVAISKTEDPAVSRLCGVVAAQQDIENPLKAAEQIVEKLKDEKRRKLIAQAAAEGDPEKLAEMIKNLKK